MSERKEQTTSRTDEQAHKPEGPSPCGPQMRQTMAKMMEACGCCAELVAASTSESPAGKGTDC